MWWDDLYQILNIVNTVILTIIGIPFGLQIIYMFFYFIPKKHIKRVKN